MQNAVGNLVPDRILFFKKALYTKLYKKQVVCSFISLYFHSPQISAH